MLLVCPQVTKVEKDANIILATSDYSFLSWISQGECHLHTALAHLSVAPQ
jgi:hypothetical protein